MHWWSKKGSWSWWWSVCWCTVCLWTRGSARITRNDEAVKVKNLFIRVFNFQFNYIGSKVSNAWMEFNDHIYRNRTTVNKLFTKQYRFKVQPYLSDNKWCLLLLVYATGLLFLVNLLEYLFFFHSIHKLETMECIHSMELCLFLLLWHNN